MDNNGPSPRLLWCFAADGGWKRVEDPRGADCDRKESFHDRMHRSGFRPRTTYGTDVPYDALRRDDTYAGATSAVGAEFGPHFRFTWWQHSNGLSLFEVDPGMDGNSQTDEILAADLPSALVLLRQLLDLTNSFLPVLDIMRQDWMREDQQDRPRPKHRRG
jgi:hypothetical protein